MIKKEKCLKQLQPDIINCIYLNLQNKTRNSIFIIWWHQTAVSEVWSLFLSERKVKILMSLQYIMKEKKVWSFPKIWRGSLGYCKKSVRSVTLKPLRKETLKKFRIQRTTFLKLLIVFQQLKRIIICLS